MMEILHELRYQNRWIYGIIIQMGSCRISIINSSTCAASASGNVATFPRSISAEIVARRTREGSGAGGLVVGPGYLELAQ